MTFAAFCCEPSMSKTPSRMPAGGLNHTSAPAAVFEDTPLLGLRDAAVVTSRTLAGNDDSDRVSIN